MSKVWYAAIVGRPNAGKSTFINALIGEKVSGVSARPQTTQRSIKAIYTDIEKDIQIIFLDTPGIHEIPKSQHSPDTKNSLSMNERINGEAFASLREADVILRFIDPTRPYGVEDERIDSVLAFSQKPVIRIETKQDLPKSYPAKDIDIAINSTNREGFEDLIESISSHLPEGPFLYDADYYTDQTVDFRITEVIREVLFLELGEEIPYACYVDIFQIENGPTLLKAYWEIYTETESQKRILIGKDASKITAISTASRITLENIFWKKVFLSLRVKVDKNWRKNQKVLSKIFPKR